jgi:hypothetical protein
MEHAARGKHRNAYRFLVGKPEGNGRLETFKRRSINNIKMGFKQTESDDVDWIHVVHKKDK